MFPELYVQSSPGEHHAVSPQSVSNSPVLPQEVSSVNSPQSLCPPPKPSEEPRLGSSDVQITIPSDASHSRGAPKQRKSVSPSAWQKRNPAHNERAC